MNTIHQNIAIDALKNERLRQEKLWGPDFSNASTTKDDYEKLAVLVEEVGEIAKALMENDRDNLFEELVQVAAVSVAWLEAEILRAQESLNANISNESIDGV